MNELQAKLARRRNQVEEGGLHFESTPVAAAVDAKDATDGRNGERRPSGGPVNMKLQQGGGADFLSAMNRRRAAVDTLGETWEKDATSSKSDVVGAGEGPTWEKPQVNKGRLKTHSDYGSAKPSPLIEPSGSPADGDGDAPGLPDAELASRQSSAGDEAKAEAEAEPEAAPPAKAASGRVRENYLEFMPEKHRVNWHLEYDAPLPSVIESPAFSIGGYESVRMKLHPRGLGAGGDCVMSLHGPSPRPGGLKAMLFLGKGWAKRSAKDWPDGRDMTETFPDANFNKRTTVLCGIVYQAP